jgi:hypothetical protein
MHYFLRVNGSTLHNNPSKPECFVPSEPPTFPATEFNYLHLCFERNIVRIGWPDTGNLASSRKIDALCTLGSLEPHVQTYLTTFREIGVGSVIAVPDIDRRGDIYLCEVIRPYHYFHQRPDDPYECAHRLGVEWDRLPNGAPRRFAADTLGIPTRGGFWTRAFHVIDSNPEGPAIVAKIVVSRRHS